MRGGRNDAGGGVVNNLLICAVCAIVLEWSEHLKGKIETYNYV